MKLSIHPLELKILIELQETYQDKSLTYIVNKLIRDTQNSEVLDVKTGRVPYKKDQKHH